MKMHKTVKSVEILFENMETVVIPFEYFGSLSISNVLIKNPNDAGNAIRINANSVEFELIKKVEEDVLGFKHDLYNPDEPGWSLFKRISKYVDIVSLELFYDDNTSEEYFVSWEDEEDNEFRNRNQICTLTENGGLFVKVIQAKMG